jgi:hypothetical protein
MFELLKYHTQINVWFVKFIYIYMSAPVVLLSVYVPFLSVFKTLSRYFCSVFSGDIVIVRSGVVSICLCAVSVHSGAISDRSGAV